MHIHHGLRHAPWVSTLPNDGHHLDVRALTSLAFALTAHHRMWQALVEHDPRERWYARLALTPSVEIWLLGWWAGQGTAFHDHGGAAGALAVVEGSLEEVRLGAEPRSTAPRRLRAGSVVPLPAVTVHRVGNPDPAPATSIHVYSPPGLPLREYRTEKSPHSSTTIPPGVLR